MKWFKRRPFGKALWLVFEDPEYETAFQRILELVKDDPQTVAFFLKHHIDIKAKAVV